MVIHGNASGHDVPSVDVDNVAGARQAVEHLLELGHRDIACITNAPLAYISATERLQGYREALDSAGLPYRPELVDEGDFVPFSGRAAAVTPASIP
jgi:DNA-binding LacI/PurR family transcriptional regulator